MDDQRTAPDADRAAEEGLTREGMPVVEDAAVLQAAEEAARHAEDEEDTAQHFDLPSSEAWVPVASAPGMDPGRSLEPIYEALCEAGIPAGFDPYRPGVAANPYPVVQRLFNVVVPQSRLGEATDTLREMHVELPAEGTASRQSTSAAHANPWRRYVAIVVALILLAVVVQFLASLLFQMGLLR